MDYDALKDGLMQAIPYNRHLGLEILEIGDGEARVRLPDAEHLNNHVGSQHAGGLFSAAEAASGAAFVGAFAERLGEITPLAKAARIDYLKLAKGPIDANARPPRRRTSCCRSSTTTAASSSRSRSSSTTATATRSPRSPWTGTSRRTARGGAG